MFDDLVDTSYDCLPNETRLTAALESNQRSHCWQNRSCTLS
jgi:hypothetical protein